MIYFMTTTSFVVTSYNIHKGMSPLNRQLKTQGMAQALQNIGSDILCLQEVQGQNLKRNIQYNEYPDQSQHEWFGEYLQLENSYGKNSEYENGHHGNAVLSRSPLDPKHNVNITVNRLEQRGVLHCEVQLSGWDMPLVVLCAHLNLLERDRLKQYEAISNYVRNEIAMDQPLILAGDFNDWKRMSCDKLASDLGMVEAFRHCHGKLSATFPAKLPVLSLDRIYVRNLAIKNAWVHTGRPWSTLSDHLPISAELAQL